MSATAWVITIFYILGVGFVLGGFAYWTLTRHSEDAIWQWIFSSLAMLLFGTIFWLSYWLGVNDASWIAYLAFPAVYAWLYVVFSTRSPALLDRVVFAAFGTVVVAMVFYGGFSAGQRGWWGMAIPFYFVAFGTAHSLIVPD